MIKAKIRGRLGNQLFIYAFARMLSEKTGENIILYDRTDEKDDMWYSHLSAYNISDRVRFVNSQKEILNMPVFSKILYVWNRLYCLVVRQAKKVKNFEEKHKELFIKHGLLICENGYFDIPECLPKDIFCVGYFQSPKYFDSIKEKLLVELRPQYPIRDCKKDFVKKIMQTNSVCLTIRLGDYMNNPVHQVCTVDYYLMAMDKMKSIHNDCCFFVFSDDIDMVKKYMNFKYDVVFDSGDGEDYERLEIMSKCKHFILSNSSFSWWAQYLSTNADKTVISPVKWFVDEQFPCDIFEETWIKLKVGMYNE